MISPIRVTPSPADTGSGPTDSAKGAKPAEPRSASLPKGGGQLENLQALGARGRAAGGKTTPEADGRRLTREPSFSEWARPASPRTGPEADGRRLTREPSFSEWATSPNPRTGPEAGGRPLTRDSSFTFDTPAKPPAASEDDDWSELDDIFRSQPTAGQASIGAPTHSLIDEPQEPLPEPAHRLVRPTPAAASKPASKPAHEAPAAGRKPARSGSFGIPGVFKRVTNWLGLGRSPSSTPARAASPRPPRVEPRPSAAPPAIPKLSIEQARREGKAVPSRPAPPPPMAGTAGHTANSAVPKLSIEQARREGKAVPSRPAPPPPMAGTAGHTAHSAIPKLSIEQARREGKAVPSRRPPAPPSMTGSVGHAVRPSTPPVEEDDLMELDIGSGKMSKPQVHEPAAQRDDSGPIATPRRAAKRAVKGEVAYHLPDLGPLSPIREGQHETGALASLGQHYHGLWRDLRGSIHQANSAIESLATTPKKGLAAKRAELAHCAAELTRLIDETGITDDETGMAEADFATVKKLKDMEGPKSPNVSESLRARAITVGWEIQETGRQRNHARNTLRALQRAIASIPDSALR